MAGSGATLYVGGNEYDIPPTEKPIRLTSNGDGSELFAVDATGVQTLPAGSITTADLAANAVTLAKLAAGITDGTTLDQSGTNGAFEIAAGGVGTTQLASLAVTSAKIANNAVGATQLTSTLAGGTVVIPLVTGRIIATNDYQNIATVVGGLLAKDTNPGLTRVNGATDIGAMLQWAASHSEPVQFETDLPDDLDDTTVGTLELVCKMSGATDTPTLTAVVMWGIGGSDIGGATTALNTTPTERGVSMVWGAGAAGQQIAIQITPGAHTTDAVNLHAIRIKYTRK